MSLEGVMSTSQGMRSSSHGKPTFWISFNGLTPRTAALDGPVLIGPRSTLNTHTLLRKSTLGADCSVSPNTTITSSCIFDEVRIGANCDLRECIIGRDVHIADGVKIGRGALIGNGVRIGKGAQIPDYARVGRERWRAEDDDEEEEEETESEEEKSEWLIFLSSVDISSSREDLGQRLCRLFVATGRGRTGRRLR